MKSRTSAPGPRPPWAGLNLNQRVTLKISTLIALLAAWTLIGSLLMYQHQHMHHVLQTNSQTHTSIAALSHNNPKVVRLARPALISASAPPPRNQLAVKVRPKDPLTSATEPVMIQQPSNAAATTAATTAANPQVAHVSEDMRTAATAVTAADPQRSAAQLHETASASALESVSGSTGTGKGIHEVPFYPPGFAADMRESRCSLMLAGRTNEVAYRMLEGRLPPDRLWPLFDSHKVDFGFAQSPSRAPYLVETIRWKPHLIDAPIFLDAADEELFWSSGLTRRYLDESLGCPDAWPECRVAKASGRTKLLLWKDLEGVTVIACGAYFRTPFDCGSGHRPTVVQDLTLGAAMEGPFDAERAILTIPPQQHVFQHFINIFLNKFGQALPLAADPEMQIYANSPHSPIIRTVWERLGLSHRVRDYTNGVRLHVRELVNTCVSPQWHRGPWQALVRALRRDMAPMPAKERFRVLYTSRADSRNGRRVINEDDVIALIRLYCTGGPSTAEALALNASRALGPPPGARFSHKKRELQVLRASAYNATGLLQVLGESNALLGVHGGAINNLVFAPIGGLKVLEMAPYTSLRGPETAGYPTNVDALWMQATTVEAEYYWMAVEPVRGADVRVDLGKLDRMLRKMFVVGSG